MINHYIFVGKMMHTGDTVLNFKYMQQGMVSAGASLIVWEDLGKGKFKEEERRQSSMHKRKKEKQNIWRRSGFSQSWHRTSPFLWAQKQAFPSTAPTCSHQHPHGGQPAVGQLGGYPAAPTTQPWVTAAALLPNTLCRHSHSDLHTT